MTRFARRAAVAVTAIAVALAPVNAAHANDLRDSLNTANQGLQVAQQGVNLLNQASPALSSGSSTSRPSQGGGGNPSTAIGGEYLNNYNLNATMDGREYQFSTYKHGSKASQSWNLDKPYSRLTATLGFDDKHLVAGYKAKVVVRADGIILGEYEVGSGSQRHIDLRLNKPAVLRIDWTITNHADKPGTQSRFIIGSPKVYR